MIPGCPPADIYVQPGVMEPGVMYLRKPDDLCMPSGTPRAIDRSRDNRLVIINDKGVHFDPGETYQYNSGNLPWGDDSMHVLPYFPDPGLLPEQKTEIPPALLVGLGILALVALTR